MEPIIKREAKETLKALTKKAGLELRRHNPHLDTGLVCYPGMASILDWYMNAGHNQKPFFIQIGANDGRYHDPLYDLVLQHRLPGLLIEPQQKVFEELKKNYKDQKQLIFEQVAIGTKTGKQSFYSISNQLNFPEDDFNFSLLSSFNKKQAYRNYKRFARKYGIKDPPEMHITELEIPTMTFDDLLAKHNITRFDILQIDAEGYDWEIIRNIDLDVHKPSMIHFEHASLGPDDQEAVWRKLYDHGYRNCLCGTDTLALSKSL